MLRKLLALALLACPVSAAAQGVCMTPGNQPIAPSELCDGTVDLGVDPTLVIESTTVGLTNNYDPGAGNTCTGFSAQGADGAYRVTISNGSMFSVSYDECPDQPQDVFDRSLYVVTDCNSPQTTCLCGADDTSPQTGASGPEECTWTNTTGGDVTAFVVCDAFLLGESGAYVLSLRTDRPVSVTPRSWGMIKSAYH